MFRTAPDSAVQNLIMQFELGSRRLPNQPAKGCKIHKTRL